MDYAELVIELSDAAGPSGYEDKVRELISSKLEGLVHEIRQDIMGNLIAYRRCGKPNAPVIMLNAHIDEIGLMVTGHEKGCLRFGTLGGIDPRMLPACEVRILTTEPIYGVVGVMPPHALSTEDMDKSLPIDKLYIDIGMSQEEAEAAIPIGTPAVFCSTACKLGKGSVCGKAMDDRACAALIIKTLEALKGKTLDFDLCCLFSTQEELGMRGAKAGAHGVEAKYAIVLDVTHGATPDAPKHKTLEMGKGAAIGVGPNFNRALTQKLINTANEYEIAHQLEAIPGNSGTDAWAIQVSRGGVATALVSLPLKYMHSSIETLLMSDAESIVELLARFIENAGEVL